MIDCFIDKLDLITSEFTKGGRRFMDERREETVCEWHSGVGAVCDF